MILSNTHLILVFEIVETHDIDGMLFEPQPMTQTNSTAGKKEAILSTKAKKSASHQCFYPQRMLAGWPVAGGRGLCRRGCGAAAAALIVRHEKEKGKGGGARTVDTLC